MLTLEQRSAPTPARQRFVAIRTEVQHNLRRLYHGTFPDLDDDAIASLGHLTMALTDGFFIANEAGELDLSHHHGLITDAVLGAAARLGDRSLPTQRSA